MNSSTYLLIEPQPFTTDEVRIELLATADVFKLPPLEDVFFDFDLLDAIKGRIKQKSVGMIRYFI